MSESKGAPDSSQRGRCYAARDAYYECIAEHGDTHTSCQKLKDSYHSNCLPSWVKYFDKKIVYDEYKKKLESEGYQPLPLDSDNKR